jgi:hypothetical protein
VVSAVGPNYGAAPGFNMRNGGMLSPHHSSYRLNGKSSRSGVGGGRSLRAHTPVSPLGVMSNTGNFQQTSGALPQDTARTPTWNGTGGTPSGGAQGDASNPFSWAPGQDGASAPLSAPLSQQFTDAAHKVVHDEVMKVCSCPRGCTLRELTLRTSG